MNKRSPEEITIIGAGLTGCFIALLLAKKGYKINIYERYPQKEISNKTARKSFNLTFYDYAVRALKEADLWEEIKPILVSLEGSFTQVTKRTKPVFVRFNQKNSSYYTVPRGKLLQILIENVLKNENITLFFETKLLSINPHKKELLIQTTTTQKTTVVPYHVLLGTDGVNSLVRAFMQKGQQTQHTQEYSDWSYKQITITKESAHTLNLHNNCQYSWTRKNAIIIAFPNGGGGFNALLILPKQKDSGFSSLISSTKIQALFKQNFPGLLAALPEITEDILANPEGNFVTVYTSPWFYKDSIVLMGDAAHGLFPFYGLGMSIAFGDCLELVRLIDEYKGEWNTIFPLYQQKRKKHTDVIADLCKDSFHRFRRDKKGDYHAVYDKLESILYTFCPRCINPPLFNMVVANPDQAADMLEKHKLQRKRARYIGIPLLVGIVTLLLTVQDIVNRNTKNANE